MDKVALHQSTDTIFSRGSNNFYTSSIFFKPEYRHKVAILYAFVRIADDFVDSIPAQVDEFNDFEAQYRALYAHKEYPRNRYTDIISAFVNLQCECNFNPEWIDAFFYSMRADLSTKEYSMPETIRYMYGSAEVVGLCMTRILNIPPEADRYAAMFARALQYINFIRDINEDNSFGRRYLPLTHGLSNLQQETAQKQKGAFIQCMRGYLTQFHEWIREGAKGFPYIAPRSRVPIKTAYNVFLIIAKRLYRNPFLVYRGKVALPKMRIMLCAVGNIIAIYSREAARALLGKRTLLDKRAQRVPLDKRALVSKRALVDKRAPLGKRTLAGKHALVDKQ